MSALCDCSLLLVVVAANLLPGHFAAGGPEGGSSLVQLFLQILQRSLASAIFSSLFINVPRVQLTA